MRGAYENTYYNVQKHDKLIYHFLKDCADKVHQLVQMTSKAARKELNSWKNRERYDDYFIPLCKLLPSDSFMLNLISD